MREGRRNDEDPDLKAKLGFKRHDVMLQGFIIQEQRNDRDLAPLHSIDSMTALDVDPLKDWTGRDSSVRPASMRAGGKYHYQTEGE